MIAIEILKEHYKEIGLYLTNHITKYRRDISITKGKRKLIRKKEYDYIYSKLQRLPKLIHQLINFTNEKFSA